jgi:hypothetical protein
MAGKIIKLYDCDSLEYCGSIISEGATWEYKDVTDEHMISVTKGMPLKGVLACLINFNMVYDIYDNPEQQCPGN